MLAPDDVIAIAVGGLAAAVDAVPQVETSRVATLDMESPAVPVMEGALARSLMQTDTVAIKVRFGACGRCAIRAELRGPRRRDGEHMPPTREDFERVRQRSRDLIDQANAAMRGDVMQQPEPVMITRDFSEELVFEDPVLKLNGRPMSRRPGSKPHARPGAGRKHASGEPQIEARMTRDCSRSSTPASSGTSTR